MVKAAAPIREGRCGAPRPVTVMGIDDVALSTPATLRCGVARATADWLRTAVIPAARQYLRAEITGLHVSASYVCRNRRNDSRTKRLSEHGRANAIDISGVTLADGRTVKVAPAAGRPSSEAKFQKAIRSAACTHFTTVLGPGSDSFHDDHLHLDMARRRSGYRLCR